MWFWFIIGLSCQHWVRAWQVWYQSSRNKSILELFVELCLVHTDCPCMNVWLPWHYRCFLLFFIFGCAVDLELLFRIVLKYSLLVPRRNNLNSCLRTHHPTFVLVPRQNHLNFCCNFSQIGICRIYINYDDCRMWLLMFWDKYRNGYVHK